MKRFLSKAFILIGIYSMMLGVFNNLSHSISYANDLELIGTELGLEVIPSDTKLFDLNRLSPGDTEEAKLTIQNNYIASFQLYMRAERISHIPLVGDPDLFNQLDLTVELRGDVIYSGKMKDFATTNIYLGEFAPGDIEDLVAIIHLPGPETGNEFQGKSLEFRWIFTAQRDKIPEEPDKPEEPDEPEEPEIPDNPVPPEESIIPDESEEPELLEEPEIPQEADIIPEDEPILPKTGEVSTILYYGAGIIFIAIGACFGFNKKKNIH